MVINYLKVVFRNFRKNKGTFTINLLGLSLGICSCLLIFLIIRYEMNFDAWHKSADQIQRVTVESHSASGTTMGAAVPFPLTEALRMQMPELKKVTQVFLPTEYQMAVDADRWAQADVLFADSAFLEVFDFPLLQGDEHALAHPNKILITEKMAAAHFGNTSPIGKTINIQHMLDLEVAGVLANPPANTHLPFQCIVSMPTFRKEFSGNFEYDNWGTTMGFSTYAVLPDKSNAAEFQKKMEVFSEKNRQGNSERKNEYRFQPIRAVHLDPVFAGTNPGYTIDVKYLWILGCTGFFLIALACINFINLSTALAIRKSKEVGVRKVMGATRTQLVTHYLGEAFLLTAISTLLALGAAELIIPYLNRFLDISLSLRLLNNPSVISFLGAILLFVGAVSGIYPAWILSGYQPIAALKNKITSAGAASLFVRKGLVVFQFVISQVLIISTLVVASQMKYLRTQPLGFTRDNIVAIPLDGSDATKMNSFRTALSANPKIISTSFAIGVPSSANNINTSFTKEGSDEQFRAEVKTVDFNYQKTFDLELVAGKWFTSDSPEAEGKEFLVNEALARQMGFSNPADAIGAEITIGLNQIKSPITGVLKDFHTQSLREAIEPIVMLQFHQLYYEAGVRISPDDMTGTIDFIRKQWEQTYSEGLFEFRFIDEQLNDYYRREQKIFTLFRIFSGISIFIGCLGLFGLISFMVVQKTKEVGVRKVLGASVSGIVLLFSGDFVKLLIIAFLLASPIAWLIMNQWLDGFAYKIGLLPQYFIIGGVMNLIIALLTIGYQSMRAAMANPVHSLRDE